MPRRGPEVSTENLARNSRIINYLRTHGPTYTDDLAAGIPMDTVWLRVGLSFLAAHGLVQKGRARNAVKGQKSRLPVNGKGHPRATRWRVHPDFDANRIKFEATGRKILG